MNLLLAMIAGIVVSSAVFIACSGLWRKMKRPIAFAFVLGWALISIAAVTQINLATQVFGLLPGTNGGTGVSSTATYPGSGTIMTTTTGVAASQLPNPSASTLGGIESITSASHSWIAYIDTSGVPHQSQPAYSDISGTPPGTTINQGVPTGTINGSNTSFTLGFTPGASSNVSCYLNGLMQQQGSGNDYTISGTAITYLTAPPTGSKLLCTGY